MHVRRIISLALAFTVLCLSLAACGSTGEPAADKGKSGDGAKKHYKIGMLPKATSDPYFRAANKGAQQAAKELGVTVDFRGPAQVDASKQSEIIDQWTQQHYDAITVSANDPDALVPSLKRAEDAGIKTATFDADTAPAGRELFLNQATFEGIGETIVEQMAAATGGKGKFLLLTAQLTAPNQNRWIEEMRKYIKAKHPDMIIERVAPAEADQAKARELAKAWLQAHKDTTGIFTVDGNALPGAAQAVEELGLTGKVVVTGIGVPSLSGADIKSGTVKSAILWNPTDIGYATIYMAKALLDGTAKPGDAVLKAGHLGNLRFIANDTVLLGDPLVFTKDNVDDFSF
jgi:rhamnose transport system substrate-binding protein